MAATPTVPRLAAAIRAISSSKGSAVSGGCARAAAGRGAGAGTGTGTAREPAGAPVTPPATSLPSIHVPPGAGCAPCVRAAHSSTGAAIAAAVKSAFVAFIRHLPG